MRLLLLALLLASAPARADMYQVASLDWIVFTSDAVVRAEVMSVADGRVTLKVLEGISGADQGPTIEAFAGPWPLRAGQGGLFAVRRADQAMHLVWIGHPVQGPAIVIDRHQRVIEGEAAIVAYIRERAAWDAANPLPAGTAPLRLDPDPALFGTSGHDNASAVLVPPSGP